jgi:hypothetical protein
MSWIGLYCPEFAQPRDGRKNNKKTKARKMTPKIINPFEYTRQDHRLFEARICTDEHPVGPLVCLINQGFADNPPLQPGGPQKPLASTNSTRPDALCQALSGWVGDKEVFS